MAKLQKPKSLYVCQECGHESPRWLGKCPSCGSWNSLQETLVVEEAPAQAARQEPALLPSSPAPTLGQIPDGELERFAIGIEELDRVLGGGAVPGSLVLIGGDPGIGKSTLLLQACARLAARGKTSLYVSGEESARQIKMRARRLHLDGDGVHVLSETNMASIGAHLELLRPDVLVVDSIQTVYRPELHTAPGSVSQIRESAAELMRFAKGGGCTAFLVGHVTKEGALAGPRVLEHMVDAVLYFEGDRKQQYRILRAVKNRFGSVNEIGVFQMLPTGMEQVANPSEFMLSQRLAGASGSAVACAMEGTRPLLVDIQALTSPAAFGAPRRQTAGVDPNRLPLLLAVLEKRAGFRLYNQDVYVNVAGGMELDEPAVDLPAVAAVASSLLDVPVPGDCALVGEIGLLGEIRAVNHIDRRLAEIARMGFASALVPEGNRIQEPPVGLRLLRAGTLSQALAALFPGSGA